MAADVTKIADVNITDSSTNTVTFSSIPQIYKTLMLMSSSQTNRPGGSNDGFRVNGLTTSIYTSLYSMITSSSASGGRSIGTIGPTTYAYHLFSNTATVASGNIYWGNMVHYFPNYTNTSQSKLALNTGGYANFESPSGYQPVITGVIGYKIATNNAITSIQFGTYESDIYFRSGSIFTLYGIS